MQFWTTVKNVSRQLNHILDCNKCLKNIIDVFNSYSSMYYVPIDIFLKSISI